MTEKFLLTILTFISFATVPVQANDLLNQLHNGGYIIFFRHAERDKTALPKVPSAIDNAATCVPGTELTAKGLADSAAIAKKMKDLRIKIDKAYASPTCRTKQMAKIFTKKYTIDRALLYSRAEDPVLTQEELPRLNEILTGFLRQQPKRGKNIVMFAHEGVLSRVVLGVEFKTQMSDAEIFSVNASGFTYLGNIPRDDLILPANAVAMKKTSDGKM